MADTDPEYRASETADDEVSEVSSSPKKAKGGGKLTLKCSWTGCCKVFHKHRHLEDHYRTHTGERPFICDYSGCYNAYTKKEHLTRHKKTHNPGTPRFSCPDCVQTFSNQSNLTRHIARTHNDCRYKCTYEGCDMSFKKNFQLKSHLNKVHQQKHFLCPQEGCGKSFSQQSHLTRHTRSHEGYTCKEEGCSVHCKTWSEIRKHVVDCHKIKHSCKTCGKQFVSGNQYRAHVKIHSKQRDSVPCPHPDCHRVYLDQRNLNIHLKVVHQGGSFKCSHDGCDVVLISKQKLKEHLEKKHNPTYIEKKKLKRAKARKKKTTQSKKSTKEEIMKMVLSSVNMKHIATSRREQEGTELGRPDLDVMLKVMNDPRQPMLADVIRRRQAVSESDLSDAGNQAPPRESSVTDEYDSENEDCDSDVSADVTDNMTDDVTDDVTEEDITEEAILAALRAVRNGDVNLNQETVTTVQPNQDNSARSSSTATSEQCHLNSRSNDLNANEKPVNPHQVELDVLEKSMGPIVELVVSPDLATSRRETEVH